MNEAQKMKQMIDEYNSKFKRNPEFLQEIKDLFNRPVIVVNTKIPTEAKPEASESITPSSTNK